MAVRCWDELVSFGALDILKREYGPYLVDYIEPEYNVSLVFDTTKVPEAGGQFRSKGRFLVM